MVKGTPPHRMKIKSLTIVTGLAAVGALLWLYERPARVTPHRPANGPRQMLPASAGGGSSAAATAKVPTGKPVPEAVRPILGLSHETPAVRWAAVRALGQRLNHAEREALYDYLRGHEAETNGPMRGVLKNDVILALKNQQPPPQELAGVLLGMFYDKEQDPVIRNYALQHLATWYDQCAEKTPVLDALWAGTTDADASIVGTALIGLSRLAQRSADFQSASAGGTSFPPVSPVRVADIDGTRLATVASALASGPTGNDLARMTALQVCAELGIKDILPAAVSLAEGAASVPLRLSALAAVGALGGADQAPLLNRLLTSDDPRIQTAARAALRRLAARPNG